MNQINEQLNPENGVDAVSPRGDRHTRESIGQRLAMRDLMSDLRDAGLVRGGPPPMGVADKQRFAKQLDSWLARRQREQ